MYLVDTNVLSAETPIKAVSMPTLTAWMDRNSASLYLSIITVAEVENGIAKSRRLGAHRKAGRLSDWLETLMHLYGSRVLPSNLQTARCVGSLADLARSQGQAPGLADLALAATARTHGYTVLTRNARHFGPLGVPALNPFQLLPTGMV